MKLLILTYGTEGDARPLIALSHALRAAGHEVHLLGEARTLVMAHKLRISASPLSGVTGPPTRAIFARGWNGMDDARLPDNVLCIGETPHEWLFPQMAAVIHHGGSGTSHSALRAGMPSIVMPFVGDQPFWAARLQQLGVARAAELGRRMSVEDGLAAGAAAMARLLAK